MRTCQRKNTSRRTPLQFAFVFGIISILFCSPNKIHAQDGERPQRGFHPSGSYALSDIETISTTNGNMILHIPMVSLPAGRGGHPGAKIGIRWNSKLWESSVEVERDPAGQLEDHNFLIDSEEGGWHYAFDHRLELINRRDSYPFGEDFPQCPDPRATNIFKLRMTFPDGSAREFSPLGYSDGATGDGYFPIRPDGRLEICAPPHYQWITTPLTYYSMDGTHLKLVIEHDGDDYWENNPWTLYLPDGGRVTYNQPGISGERIYDSNNNYIEIQRIIYNGHPAARIADQLGRSLIVEYGATPSPLQDFVHMRGIDNQEIRWTVKWKEITVNKTYFRTHNLAHPTPLNIPLVVVDQIILPDQAAPGQPGALNYTFGYNAGTANPSTGWGEISSVTMPSDPQDIHPYQAGYSYFGDNSNNLNWELVLKNRPTRKDLTYLLEYDGSSQQASETWLYSIGNTLTEITEPDGGVVREHFASTQVKTWDSGLVYKTERPDGTVGEQIWQRNLPIGASGFAATGNAYVKTEFISQKDVTGVLVKTAIKNYNRDKNGNVTQVAEYDCVAYSSVPRDGNGRPTGIPGGLTPKRVTVNTYYNPTPDASDTTTDDPDVYHKPTSQNIRGAIESSETRSDFSAGSVVSRAESFYDDPSTTGNLTLVRKWDSTKGGISLPLTAVNSISVAHQYDPFGNRALTTDANGVQTQFIYDPINGHGNLYVTQTKMAPGAAVQRWTMQSYDFYTGLVTQSTDVDNNVTTRMTYDVFGRPTLVEEADGIVGVEKQTATEYSDTQRRVIVRSDLNTTGDGKLIAIQHYDQLGRICLTRRLENGNPAEATDKTKGVKIQTRYFEGDAGNQNGYALVSAPYRAATSGAAGGEPGMAWNRTKFDKGGRVIEVETFIGATPPAPWGSNSVSSGKVATEYDAEFTTVTDQAGKKRRGRVDGLGRLVRVDEPDAVGNLGGTAAPVQPTDYSYNALDNLIQTSQTGVPNGGSTPVTQIRNFIFSSLGRLISANNPESGVITHEYDANGNLKKKTDAHGIVINYTYDELNRDRTLDYSNTAVNPDITRVYDNPAPGAHGKGKFWKDYAGGDENNGQNVEHKEIESYDALGRPLSVRRKFKNNGAWSAAFTTSQTYDLAGHVKTKTYPSGRSVTYTYDVAGDLTDFTGNLGDGVSRTYSTGAQYNLHGQLTREQFGTSTALYHRRHYNSRGQLFDVRLGTDGAAVSDGPNPAQWTGASWNRGALRMFFSSNLIEYAWPAVSPQQNNGNLYRQDHFVPTALDGAGAVTSWVMSADYYCYDSLNRVAQTAEETYTSGGGYAPNVFNQRFIYDRFGNRLVSSATGTGTPNPGYKINGANNRLIAPTDVDGNQAADKMRYDVAGNLIKDTHTQTGTTGNRTYDAENRMLTADGTNGLANSYTYDADGQRTRRSLNNGGEVWWQVYGVGGELVAEYQLIGGTPALKKEYGYRNGQLLVVWDGNETGDRQLQWLVQDHLGSTRMVVDRSGSLGGMRRHDFVPFGEELSAGVGIRSASNGYNSDSVRQKYTGYERDDETKLDFAQARYFSSIQGRFTSPDEPFAGQSEEDPQTWNLYSYTSNNPLSRVDSDGRRWFYQQDKDGNISNVEWVNPNSDGTYTSPGDGWIEFIPTADKPELTFTAVVNSEGGTKRFWIGENEDGSPYADSIWTGKVTNSDETLMLMIGVGTSIRLAIRAAPIIWQAHKRYQEIQKKLNAQRVPEELRAYKTDVSKALRGEVPRESIPQNVREKFAQLYERIGKSPAGNLPKKTYKEFNNARARYLREGGEPPGSITEFAAKRGLPMK